MNGEMFLAWVEQDLAPVLRDGELVILDNLATRKILGVREAVEERGNRCSLSLRIRFGQVNESHP